MLILKVLFIFAMLLLASCSSKPKSYELSSNLLEHGWVQEELNKLEQTYDVQALCRSISYRDRIQKIFRQEQIPLYFDAIAFIETGYRNVEGHDNAGLWYLELRTAQLYRLRVTEKLDERMDFFKSTDMVVRYLRTMHEIFDDWLLVALSYHLGEEAVLSRVRERVRPDPWKIEEDLSPRTHYLSRFVAAVFFLDRHRGFEKRCPSGAAGTYE